MLNLIENLDVKDEFKKLLGKIKTLRVSLNQMSYIIPVLVVLNKYFNLEYFYIINGNNGHNLGCKMQLLKYNLIKDNIYFVTKEEFANKVKEDYNRYGAQIIYLSTNEKFVYYDLVPKNIINQITFNCNHGIDEEAFLITNYYKETIFDYYLFSSIVDISYNMIDTIYQLDKNKKTILFQDTGRTFTHLLPHNDHQLVEIQNKMFDNLIQLKEKYNIIVRFHPVYFHSDIVGHNCISKKIRENFIIDFTQFSLLDLYNKADIIISNRSTSSGYQSLFLLNKNIIMIDMNLEIRKNALFKGYEFGYPLDNNYLINLMNDGKILNKSLVVTDFEDNIDLLNEVQKIENNNFIVSEHMITNRINFIEKNWNINLKNLNDKNGLFYLLMFIVSQIKDFDSDVLNLLNMLQKNGICEKMINTLKKYLLKH